MYTPSIEEFIRLTKKFNVIPVYKEISADLDTPVSSFLKIKKNEYAFLLESVEGQENIARYSFLGSNPAVVFRSRFDIVEIAELGRHRIKKFTTKDPLQEVKKMMSGYRSANIKGLPRFYGGFVGYIGYDMVRFWENIPDKNTDALKLPDCVLMLTDNILVFDHVNHTIKIICNVILPGQGKELSKKEKTQTYNRGITKIEEIARQLSLPLNSKTPRRKGKKESGLKVSSNLSKPEFCRIVNKAKGYIRSGDIIQVVLSQRFKARVSKEPFDIYRTLRGSNPSPYMFFLKFKEVTLIGSSPEMLVRCEGGTVETRPIAGTRPRGKNESQDRLLEKELLNDEKEKAEHLMLVDLGRNDLGRIAKAGKVRVKEFMRVERYSHVMHLVSDVVGELNQKYDAYDVLRACFPAGTVSGSPKVRAMEIIDELENTRRGPYAGCVGYFGFSGNMDTGITLRTIILKDKVAYIQAGAGIVLDSVADKEYNESLNKARALLEAIK
jgi:anthranilate synthase component 1